MKLEALKKFPYGKRVLAIGEMFDASDKDGNVLKKMRRAKDADSQKTSDLPGMSRRYVQTQEEPKAETPKKPRGRPRKYERRDMVATDGPTGEENSSPS